jgi:hypothetical protein
MGSDEQTITIDLTGSKGLAPRFYADQPYSIPSPNLRYQAQDGMAVGGVYNPFRRLGYMSPSNTATKNVTITGNSLFTHTTAWEYDSLNQNAYLATGSIVATGTTDLSTFASSMTLTNWTSGSVRDMAIYQVNGKRTLMVMGVFNFGGVNEGRIATHDLDHGLGNTINYLGTGGSVANTFGLSVSPSKMIPADNSFMYILDNNAVHKLDGTLAGGTNGTITANALTFPAWMVLTDGLDLHGKLYMGVQDTPSGTSFGNYAGFCGVYIWDRQTTTFGFQDFVIIPQAHFIRKLYVSPAGKIRAIISTTSNETAIVEYNGVSFETIARLGVNSFPPYYDSAQVVDSGIWWQTFDGQIFFYGTPAPEMNGNAVDAMGNIVSDAEALYCVGNFTPAGTIGGTLFYGSNLSDYSAGVPTGMRASPEGFFLSYRDVAGSAFFMKKWYPHAEASASLITPMATDIGNVFYPVRILPIFSSIDFVKIACAPLADDTIGNTTVVATVKVFYNMSTTPAATVAVTRNACLSGAVDIPCAKNGVFAIQMKIEFNTAQSVGPFDFHPYMAVVNYTPSVKRR